MLVFACSAGQAFAGRVVKVGSREALVVALDGAKAGDRIEVAAGRYEGGISARRIVGTEAEPIVIVGADRANPPVIAGGASGVQLSSPQWVELRDLVLEKASGNGLNIDDGGSSETPARAVTLTNVVVREVGPRGNSDGIKLSGLVGFQVEGCRIEKWGASGSGIDMVGCRDGVVSRCRFVGPGGSQANGVQMKGGSRDVVVRRCRIENAGGRGINAGGHTGLAYFRPRVEGYEAKDLTIEDCEIVGADAAIAFVGVDGAVARHNTIYRPTRWAMRVLQENVDPQFTPCRNVRVLSNVVAFRSDEMRQAVNVGAGTAPESFEFRGNQWWCLDRPEATGRLVRAPGKVLEEKVGVDPGFRNAEAGDLGLVNRKAMGAGVRDEVEVQ
jgi:hypothetical protein